MLTKNIDFETVRETRNKRAIFQELLAKNEALEKALFILDEMQAQTRALPYRLRERPVIVKFVEQAVGKLNNKLNIIMAPARVVFEDLEKKLNIIENYFLHEECDEKYIFICMVSDVKHAQIFVDATFSTVALRIDKIFKSFTSKYKIGRS